jgi:hypothetical protein
MRGHHDNPRMGTILSRLLMRSRQVSPSKNRAVRNPNQPGRDALRHHVLKYFPQGIALAKALMPRTAKHRMIGNVILNAELAEPSVRQVNLHL